MNPKQPSPGWLVSRPLHPLPHTLSAVTPWSLGCEGVPLHLFPSVVGGGSGSPGRKDPFPAHCRPRPGREPPAAPPTWPSPQPAPTARQSCSKPEGPPGGGVSAPHPSPPLLQRPPDTPSLPLPPGPRGLRREGFVRSEPGRTRAPQSEGRGGPSGAASRGGRCCRRGGEWGGAGGQAVGEGGVLRGGERRSDFLGGCRASGGAPTFPQSSLRPPCPAPSGDRDRTMVRAGRAARGAVVQPPSRGRG